MLFILGSAFASACVSSSLTASSTTASSSSTSGLREGSSASSPVDSISMDSSVALSSGTSSVLSENKYMGNEEANEECLLLESQFGENQFLLTSITLTLSP